MRCENVTCILKELEPETVARILGVCGVQTTAIILGKMYSESVAKVVGVMAPETVRLCIWRRGLGRGSRSCTQRPPCLRLGSWFFGLKFRRHRVRLEKFLAGHRMHGTVCETFIEALLKWKGVCKQSKFAKEVDRKIFIWITGVCHSLIARVVLGTPFYAILRHSH